MKVMEQNYIKNSTFRLLLPLYDFDFVINNEYLFFIKAFNYCPQFPYNLKLLLLYKVTNKKGAEKILFPYLFKKEYLTINDELYLIVIVNIPSNFERNYEDIINNNFSNVDWDCKNRILFSKFNSDLDYALLHEILMETPNVSIKQTSKNVFKFSLNDMLDLDNIKSHSKNVVAFLLLLQGQ